MFKTSTSATLVARTTSKARRCTSPSRTGTCQSPNSSSQAPILTSHWLTRKDKRRSRLHCFARTTNARKPFWEESRAPPSRRVVHAYHVCLLCVCSLTQVRQGGEGWSRPARCCYCAIGPSHKSIFKQHCRTAQRHGIKWKIVWREVSFEVSLLLWVANSMNLNLNHIFSQIHVLFPGHDSRRLFLLDKSYT